MQEGKPLDSAQGPLPGPGGGPRPSSGEAVIVALAAAALFWLSGKYDFLEKAYRFSREHEGWDLDEFFVVGLFLCLYFLVLAIRQWRKVVAANRRLAQLNRELQQASREIEQLQGIIPICARCKSIRDDAGYWQKVESYLHARAHVKFTHGICPECAAILYPEYDLSKVLNAVDAAKGGKEAKEGGDQA